MQEKKETPLMKQYKEIKLKNRESILFFRLGDFYEMFFEDAVIASRELGITLTSRNKEKGEEVPLAGVPYHSAAAYISKLVNKGYKVAICEQTEDPKEAKGIVKREVVKIVSPGTIIDIDSLDEKSNNYLASFKVEKELAGISFIDISTGEFKTLEIKSKNPILNIMNELFKINPSEIITDKVTYNSYQREIDDYIKIYKTSFEARETIKNSEEYLKNHFNLISLESYGIAGKNLSIETSALALSYVLELQKYSELPINKIEYINNEKYMDLNLISQKNLEIIENFRDKSSEASLFKVLNKTKTSNGTRLLKQILKNPMINKEDILNRQADVDYFIDEIIIREEIREKLKNVYDLERLISKVILGSENGRDLNAIKKSLISAVEIKRILEKKSIINTKEESLIQIINLIENSIKEEAPFSIREGGIIREGYNKELDELFEISSQGKNYILKIENQEREKTGIKNLKIKYNKIFGYFIEITNSNINLVPDYYIRKQTLSNAERYITPDLKDYELRVLNAKEKIEALEYELFKEISSKIKDKNQILQNLAKELAYIDVISSFAEVAVRNNYVKPIIEENYELEIKDARHPVVEILIGEEDFVKNDIYFNENERFIILTGPNMAGKSTYMKQLALIIIMAQIGSYVPASYAKIGIVDKIFTRIGASDDLLSGQSTFMLEMSEAANIVNNATEKSFIILDEVGRGTSTFDGISIASAISEYIHDRIKAKTIFATHYHELTELEKKYKNMVNFRIEVKETEREVLFLRKITRGGADKSYGIEVARLAGLPQEILKTSKEILRGLERKRAIIEKKINVEQLSLFQSRQEATEEKEEKNEINNEIIYELENIDLNNLTPLEALNKLNDLKKLLKKGK